MQIKNLTVTVTYLVGLGDIEIPENVFDQFIQSAVFSKPIQWDNPETELAHEWLSNNIKERECFDWSCEINEVTVKE